MISLIVVLILDAIAFYVWSITDNFWFLVSALGIAAILLAKFLMK